MKLVWCDDYHRPCDINYEYEKEIFEQSFQ